MTSNGTTATPEADSSAPASAGSSFRDAPDHGIGVGVGGLLLAVGREEEPEREEAADYRPSPGQVWQTPCFEARHQIARRDLPVGRDCPGLLGGRGLGPGLDPGRCQDDDEPYEQEGERGRDEPLGHGERIR